MIKKHLFIGFRDSNKTWKPRKDETVANTKQAWSMVGNSGEILEKRTDQSNSSTTLWLKFDFVCFE